MRRTVYDPYAVLAAVFADAVGHVTGIRTIEIHVGIVQRIGVSPIAKQAVVEFPDAVLGACTVQEDPLPVTRGRNPIGPFDGFPVFVIIAS